VTTEPSFGLVVVVVGELPTQLVDLARTPPAGAVSQAIALDSHIGVADPSREVPGHLQSGASGTLTDPQRHFHRGG
jgi:hypothetical protein